MRRRIGLIRSTSRTKGFTVARWGAEVGLAFALTLLSAGVVLANTPGTWSPTGSMRVGRENHEAVLLTNGKVLVVGGLTEDAQFGSLVLSAAELYDPVGSWSSTGGLGVARQDHAAILLANGRLLIAGGSDQSDRPLRSAELFDPFTGTWSPTGSLRTPRGSRTATLLPSGKVLVVGGQNASAELYDPMTGTWTPTGSLHAARVLHTATLLPNGKVLVAGGIHGVTILASAELYDPASGTWSPAASLHIGRVVHTATLLANGRVLVVGGQRAEPFADFLASAELYDPSSGTWSQTGSLNTPRQWHTANLLPSGSVLVAGGQTEQPSASSAELYDPTVGTWKPTGSLSTGRVFHTATLLADGTVLVTGGINRSTFLESAELYTPPSAALLPSSCGLTAGGTDANGHAFIRVAARDIASGLQSVRVLQATNASVALPNFPPGYRDPAVVTATKVDSAQPSVLELAVTNRDGKTLTCDPVMTTLVGQRHGSSLQVFKGIPQAESKVLLKNDRPGIDRVDLYVNGHRFRLDNLEDAGERTLDLASAMRPGSHNMIVVRTQGPHTGSALLVISD